jgi:hypothetical protein
MDRNNAAFAGPEAHTRHDTAATGTVLAVILASVLCGVFLVDADPSPVHAGEVPARYAALDASA